MAGLRANRNGSGGFGLRNVAVRRLKLLRGASRDASRVPNQLTIEALENRRYLAAQTVVQSIVPAMQFPATIMPLNASDVGANFAASARSIAVASPRALTSPTVTAISPTQGPLAGGTMVTITGTNFTGATEVDFGVDAATNLTVVSDTQITVSSPAEPARTVDVTVTTPNGTSATSAADQFTFASAMTTPTVTALSPTHGSSAGGTTVTITGTNFIGATAVDFGAVAATNLTVVSPTQITVTSPAEAAATVDVTVTTPNGTSATSASDQFTFDAVSTAPTITAIAPTTGPTTGGTMVTITGTNFTGATAVKFGTVAATNLVVVSPTQITATSPAEVAGTVDVTVTTANGTSATSAADQFTFAVVSTRPTVTAIAPTTGPTTGGTTVTITGTNFTTVTGVKFGTVAATNFTVVSSTEITVTTPAEAAGTVNVTVTTTNGTSAISPADQFTFGAVTTNPTVTGVDPTQGPPAGGTMVTITGTNFTGATAVNFGNIAATDFTVVSSTQITATTPAEAAGTVDVTVVTPNGTSATSASDQFQFGTVTMGLTVTAVAPAQGTIAGGTLVTLTGTGFTGATAVDFGTVAATSFTVVSATEITATTPAEAAGTVNVTVTTPSGTSPFSAGDQFTFQTVNTTAPTVTGISPAVGSTVGGTTVTITGTNFTGATAVEFGNVAATSFTVISSTKIIAVSPAGTAGPVDVTVTTSKGTSAVSAVDEFDYAIDRIVLSIGESFTLRQGHTTLNKTDASFTDTLGKGPYTVTVNYGDGTGLQPVIFNGSDQLTLSHHFNGNFSQTYVVTVTVYNRTSASQHSFDVTVVNEPPRDLSVRSTIKGSATTAAPFEAIGRFIDNGVGQGDFFRIYENFGDGTPIVRRTISKAAFDLAHQYTHPGHYKLVITVIDDGGDEANWSQVINVFAPTPAKA